MACILDSWVLGVQVIGTNDLVQHADQHHSIRVVHKQVLHRAPCMPHTATTYELRIS